MRTTYCITLALIAAHSLFGSVDSEKEVAVVLTRTDSVPLEVEQGTDQYFEGYLQALVDMHFSEYRVVVIVKHREVWLANLPNNSLIAKAIVTFVKDVPGVKAVHVLNGVPPKDEEIREKYVKRPRIGGIWFPQMTELFQPLVADPRNVTYAIGYRSGDHIVGKKAVDISLGDDFGVYRWLDVLYHGDLQIGIEAGMWTVFNMDPNSPNIAGGTEMVNADFYVGVPITYAKGKWSFRLRGYHISSHLGDEFLVNHPGFVDVNGPNKDNPSKVRVNPSNEYLDFAVSYQATDVLRVYAFPGVIVHSDPTFKWQPMYIQYGTEIRFFGMKFHHHKLHGSFFLAMHWRNFQQLDWNFDGTYRGGYEFSKLQGIGRKLRLYVEYHHGYSLEGQFSKMRTNYWQFNFNYGF